MKINTSFTTKSDQYYQSSFTNLQPYDFPSTGNRVDNLPDDSVFFIEITISEATTQSIFIKLDAALDSFSDEPSTVVDRIRSIDENLDLPRKVLADILGISRTTLYEILNGTLREYRNESRLKKVEEAVRVINLHAKYLIGRSVILVKLGGVTLAEILKSEKIDLHKVEALTKAINKRKDRTRQAPNQPGVRAKQHALTPIAD